MLTNSWQGPLMLTTRYPCELLCNKKRCSRELWHLKALATAQHRCDAQLHRQLRHARQEVGGGQESVHTNASVWSQLGLAAARCTPQ